ncbi:MAG: hypothetical protein H6Q29_1152, partial [Bacteroidetes bacterium]|nr:hypothetical protein [Bacteroidota bacterium]
MRHLQQYDPEVFDAVRRETH